MTLLWGALGVLGYRIGWQRHAAHARTALLRYEPSPTPIQGSAAPCNSQPATPETDGVLAGVLHIPKLAVKAPVESGTSDQVLNDAVGHFDGTPWPGQHGTSVLLAHDVSYFGHIGSLQQGDRIAYQSGCETYTFTVVGHRVVRNGAPVPSLAGAGLVLDTCWPTDALWYTPDRYLVEAVQSEVAVGNPPSSSTQPQFSAGYAGTASPALQATGLTLESNEERMGSMSFQGSPSPEWAQSPAPLALEVAALANYFGGYHAATNRSSVWWNSVAPAVPMPTPLSGARPGLSAAAPLNVTITAAGSHPQTVLLHTVLPLYGGSNPGTYAMDVTEAVHGTTVSITNWEVTRD